MKHTSIFLFVLFVGVIAKAAPPAEEGKVIFSSRCAACHNIQKVLTGPALAGVDQRRSIDWIINFVHSSQTVVQSGDPYAVALFNKFNKIRMPDHPDLTADNIKSIVAFIKTESKAGNEKPPFAKPGKLRPNYIPLSITNYGVWIGYFLLVMVLMASLLFAVHVKELGRKEE
jgi:cytochrome c551/c552